MDFDIKIYVSILILGIISGLGFANIFSKDFSAVITTLGTYMAGVGAIGTMLIAFQALKGWKNQSDYSLVMTKYEECLGDMDRYMLVTNRLNIHYLKRERAGTNLKWSDELSRITFDCMIVESSIRKSLSDIKIHLPNYGEDIPQFSTVFEFFHEREAFTGLMQSISWEQSLPASFITEVSSVIATYRSLRKEIKNAF